MERYDTAEAYFAATVPSKRSVLMHIRELIRTTVPDAVEIMSYGMPAFKYKGQPLMYYAAFKDHLSLFPTSQPIAVLADKLIDYKHSKGTIQFTLEKPLPDMLIQGILQERCREIDAQG